jgi:predicted amidohydrolase
MHTTRSLLLLAAGALSAATPPLHETGFKAGPGGVPEGWTVWSPRAEIAPRTFLDTVHYRTRPASLAISGNGNAAVLGGWERKVAGVEGGAWYRFAAWYRAAGVPFESLQVFPRVDWTNAKERRAGPPDYVYQAAREGDWTRVSADLQAPRDAVAARLQLYLFNAPQGTVWWDDISFERIPAPKPRPVTIASVNLRPQSTRAADVSVTRFIEAIDKLVPAKTDIVLLPEGITVIGTGKSYVDVSETVPGPTTERLAQVAKRRSTYIAAGLYEREGHTVYNTAILLDREGRLAGKYRKVYLPIGEIEGGLTPGSEFPVFRTDFGTVGMMICYDVFFPDPARALARSGAEILLLPIWGGNEVLAQARAIDNQVFLVASGYDHPTYVMDPEGTRIATAPLSGSVAVATVDLAQRWTHSNLGEMRARRMKEWRVDVRVP